MQAHDASIVNAALQKAQMNAYKPTHRLLRVVFAAMALTATIASASLIEGLVRSYTVDAAHTASATPVKLAEAKR